MFKKLIFAYKVFKVVYKHKVDIFTLMMLIDIYIRQIEVNPNIPKSDDVEFALLNCKTKLPFIESFRDLTENQKNLNSVTESIRKYGLRWVESTKNKQNNETVSIYKI